MKPSALRWTAFRWTAENFAIFRLAAFHVRGLALLGTTFQDPHPLGNQVCLLAQQVGPFRPNWPQTALAFSLHRSLPATPPDGLKEVGRGEEGEEGLRQIRLGQQVFELANPTQARTSGCGKEPRMVGPRRLGNPKFRAFLLPLPRVRPSKNPTHQHSTRRPPREGRMERCSWVFFGVLQCCCWVLFLGVVRGTLWPNSTKAEIGRSRNTYTIGRSRARPSCGVSGVT